MAGAGADRRRLEGFSFRFSENGGDIHSTRRTLMLALGVAFSQLTRDRPRNEAHLTNPYHRADCLHLLGAWWLKGPCK